MLERLRSLHDSRIGILTRNGKSIARATLAACGLLEFFEPEAILSRDCCAPKPQPHGILQILQCWDATPDRGVMVGDYIFDLLAGRNAGTATVHLDVTGSFDWPKYTDCCVTLFNIATSIAPTLSTHIIHWSHIWNICSSGWKVIAW